MKHLGTILTTLSLAAAPALAAQDTTQAQPPATPALEVSEAVVAKSVVDRAPQDTGSAFTPDVGQVVCWTKLSGGGHTRYNTGS